MKEQLMKSAHVLKRYNQIKSAQGTESADKWLDMLTRNVQVKHVQL